jgi:predicted AAA+ superfamily ATPase
MERSWKRTTDLVILDEIHKMKNWKSYLKGFYDSERQKPPILVTGSARMDLSRKTGDSLAGRHFSYRLFPFDPKELPSEKPDEVLENLLHFSGFPEPLFKGKSAFYGKWKKTYLDAILRNDLLDLEQVRDIAGLETLFEMLRDRVGSPISFLSLGRDLQKDPNTVKRWLDVLERLYLIFRITPYHKNIARSILKESKFYFFDVSHARSLSARIENTAALSLLKEIARKEDCEGIEGRLYYLKTKDGKKIDFLITEEGQPVKMIEVKESDDSPSKNFDLFQKHLNLNNLEQWVYNLKREKDFPSGVKVRSLAKAMSKL